MYRFISAFLLVAFCAGRVFAEASAPTVLDDELKRRINYFQPNDAQIVALNGGGVGARKAMEDMLQSINLQAITIAKLLVDDVAAKYEVRLAAQDRQIAVLEARIAMLERSNGQGIVPAAEASLQQNAIESRIASDFKGLEMGKMFLLENGQIWRQTEPYIWIWYAVRPQVIIFRSGTGAFKMKVEGIDYQVMVERLK